MKINGKLLKCRSRLEENLKWFIGILAYVPQLSPFFSLLWLQWSNSKCKRAAKEDIEAFRERILKIIEEISIDLNIKKKVISAKMVPSMSLRLSLNYEDLCEDCKEEYENGEEYLTNLNNIGVDSVIVTELYLVKMTSKEFILRAIKDATSCKLRIMLNESCLYECPFRYSPF